MILRFHEGGRVVIRDLNGEELYQTLRDRTTKDGNLKDEILIFKGMWGKAGPGIDGLYPWIFSTNIVDRMGDIVDQSWRLENYKSNPVILWAHNHSIPAIGFAESVDVSGDLSGRIRFNPAEIDAFGASIGARVDFGSIRAGSVGFMPGKVDPIEETSSGKTFITGWKLSENELHEFSICNVPANPMALGVSEKPKSVETKPDPKPEPSKSRGFQMFIQREEEK